MIAAGSISNTAPRSSTTSSCGSFVSAKVMVYSMPAQPPFLMPIRKPNAPGCASTRSRTRVAAASVSVTALGIMCSVGISFYLATMSLLI